MFAMRARLRRESALLPASNLFGSGVWPWIPAPSHSNRQVPNPGHSGRRSLQRNDELSRQVEDIQHTPGVKYYSSVIGYSMLSGVNNTYRAPFFFIAFDDWSARKKPDEQ